MISVHSSQSREGRKRVPRIARSEVVPIYETATVRWKNQDGIYNFVILFGCTQFPRFISEF